MADYFWLGWKGMEALIGEQKALRDILVNGEWDGGLILCERNVNKMSQDVATQKGAVGNEVKGVWVLKIAMERKGLISHLAQEGSSSETGFYSQSRREWITNREIKFPSTKPERCQERQAGEKQKGN